MVDNSLVGALSEDILEQIIRVRGHYEDSSKNTSFNAFIYGKGKTGKTTIIGTARKPIWIDSFDPGGSKVLREAIGRGEVIVDSRYEDESYKKPSACKLWDEEFQKKLKSGLFNHLGTYVIDSGTKWQDAILHTIVARHQKAGKRPDFIPAIQDYLVQQHDVIEGLATCCCLPCDFIVTGHLEYDKDEMTGQMLSSIMTVKKLKEKTPILFDEIYLTIAKPSSSGIKYNIMTVTDGLCIAGTRIGGRGKFKAIEEPDIKGLLKKAGLPFEDKPLI